MPRYRIRNRSNKPITDGQKSLPPGGEFDVCAAVRFVNGAGTSFLENTPGEVVQRINRAAARAGCGEQVKGAVVQPTEEGDPEDKAPIGGDSAKAQGAPAPVGQAAEVKIVRGAYGEPGEERTPAEALADPQQPASEGQVQQQAMAEGQDLETASKTVERGLRGDPPEGEERSTHTGDVAQQAAQGGDPAPPRNTPRCQPPNPSQPPRRPPHPSPRRPASRPTAPWSPGPRRPRTTRRPWALMSPQMTRRPWTLMAL